MNILIIGGGIAGLAFANFLEQNNVNYHLIEKQKNWKDGYVISLWNNGLSVLRKLNLDLELKNIGFVAKSQKIYNNKGVILKQDDFRKIKAQFQPAIQFLHRHELQRLLVSKLNKENIEFNQEVIAIEHLKGKTTVETKDGEKRNYDLVVGADGGGSFVRKLLFSNGKVLNYNLVFFSFVTNYKDHGLTGNVEQLGNSKMFGIYPISNNKVGVYASAKPNPKYKDYSSQKLIQTYFSHFKGHAENILSHIEDVTDIISRPIQEVDLDNWYQDNIVLIGDAAHAMLPTTGQGVSAALEDAMVLFDELKFTNFTDLQSSFSAFQHKRQKKNIPIQKNARFINKILMIESIYISLIRNFYLKFTPNNSNVKSLNNFFKKN